MPGDWYRSANWSREVEEEFERRLRRARPHNRPQYLRIKGLALTQSEDPAHVEAGRALLRRVVEDYPDSLDRPAAQIGLGDLSRHLGRFDEAEHHYREVLELAEPSASTDAELALAELIAETHQKNMYREALRILDTWRGEERGLTWYSQAFRYYRAVALIASDEGEDERAVRAALEALRVADAREPQLPRHPHVGFVQAPPSQIQELKRIAESG